MSLEFNEIKKLTELFNPKRNNSDSEDETEECADNQICRVDNEDTDTQATKKVNPYSKIERDESKREILDPEEVETFLDGDCRENNTKTDWKKTPVWDIIYKQQITSSDVFLQMGFKNPTTASCEDMIVSIHLPGDNHYNIDLKIQKDTLTLFSPTYYLDLRLPHPVDPQKGNAKWDGEQEKLVVTLRMDRELDLVNF